MLLLWCILLRQLIDDHICQFIGIVDDWLLLSAESLQYIVCLIHILILSC